MTTYSLNVVGEPPAVQLLLTDREVRLIARSPEQAIEEIQFRATQMSRVLEQILHEPHGKPHWGLNE